jgi:serpin B
MKKRIIAVVLSLLFSLASCGTATKSQDLMSGVRANEMNIDVDLTGESSSAVENFAVNLFQNSVSPDKNSLISPISVLYALAMTANGARGETLTQMEQMVGLPVDELNQYLHTY